MTLEDLKLTKGWESFLNFRRRKLSGIRTGIGALDRTLLGLSGVVVIQGAPGCNKSTLALQIALHQIEQGNPVLFIDRENGRERLRLRLLCSSHRLSATDVLEAPEPLLVKLVQKVVPYPLYAHHGEVKSYADLKALLEALEEGHPGKPLMLVVDSIQALPRYEGSNDERTSISLWLNALDQAKLDWDGRLVIVATSEKSRGQGGMNYEQASMGAGKGSGALEYKAEQVIDLRRANGGGIIAEILKNRDGLAGISITLRTALSSPTNPESFCFRLEEEVTL